MASLLHVPDIQASYCASEHIAVYIYVACCGTQAHQQLKQRQGKINFKQWSLNPCFATMTSVSIAGQTHHYVGERMTHSSE